MRILNLAIIAILAISCSKQSPSSDRRANFPTSLQYVSTLPHKKNFWIFILAGQSNMAGRGLVSPEDTLSSSNILAIDTTLQWYLAKEPLHFYEPSLKGLDCGLSFARELDKSLNDSIYIGLIPCAVGGSSVEQWLGDSVHRKVKLFSNFEDKVRLAKEVGTIKGILWHQGESNAHPGMIGPFEEHLKLLFKEFRTTVGNDSLPIVVGEMASFLKYKNGVYGDSINQVLWKIKLTDPFVGVVKTDDLTHKGDSLHFNAKSLRTMGKRYAEKYQLILK